MADAARRPRSGPACPPGRDRRSPCRALGRRQWAAVSTARGPSTMPVQKPSRSPPRASTMTRRSAKRAPDSLGPTTAPAGAVAQNGGDEAGDAAPRRPNRVNLPRNLPGIPISRDWRAARPAAIVARIHRSFRGVGKDCDMPRVSTTVFALASVGARRRLGPRRRGRGSRRAQERLPAAERNPRRNQEPAICSSRSPC